jgi:hypothetical protein
LQNTKPWCQAIRGVNTALQPLVAAQRRVLAEKQARVERNLQVETVLMNREYSSFLFPEKDLRDFLLAISP